MKKLAMLLLVALMLTSVAAQADVIVISTTSGIVEDVVLRETIFHTDELEFAITSFTHAAGANDYTHQTVKITALLQNWGLDTFDAVERISFEARYADFLYSGTCMQGESVPVEMLMEQSIGFEVRVPNALIYAEEAAETQFVLIVGDTEYILTAEQCSQMSGQLVSTTEASVAPSFAMLKADGTLWTWGNNEFGQLGDGTLNSRTTPVQVLDDVIAISVDTHMAAIRSDGTLWTWGQNKNGQLGNGTTQNSSTPIQVMEGVTAVKLGSGRTFAIDVHGNLWAWGSNYDGCLGTGSNQDSALPVKIVEDVVDAAPSNGSHSLILKSDGTVWGCGYNWDGRIGDGTRDNHYDLRQAQTNVAAISTGLTHSAIVRKDGTAWVTDGKGGYTQVMSDVVDVSAGVSYTLLLGADGTLWACGSDKNGKLGNGSAGDTGTPVAVLSNVICMDTGAEGAIALCADGSVWTWGWNGAGSYENGNLSNADVPTDTGLNIYK